MTSSQHTGIRKSLSGDRQDQLKRRDNLALAADRFDASPLASHAIYVCIGFHFVFPFFVDETYIPSFWRRYSAKS
jgi:hypothetical protein